MLLEGRPSWTADYKVEAWHRVIDTGHTIAEFARELGIDARPRGSECYQTVLTVRHESVRGPAGSEWDAVRERESQIEAGQAPPLGETPERGVVRAADIGVSTRFGCPGNVSGDDRVACRSLVSVDINDETSHKMLGHFEWFKDFLDRGGNLVLLDVVVAERGDNYPVCGEAGGQGGEIPVVRRLCESGEQIGDLGSIHQPTKLFSLCPH